ncbi:MAG TPA: L,D-transpeptidase family protein [Mucilaginibacter sp.]|jgi:D-alanyl-D-alanine dipeptidase|nr:L,D-transpeptidase family protein [Mucilaginibacter sp.]
MMKKLLNCAIALTLILPFELAGRQHNEKPPKPEIFKCRQLLVVVNNGWDSLRGRLYAFKKVNGKWKIQFSNAIVLGKKGIALGDGLVKLNVNGPIKHEGDKRSPAGIFSIGTAFGYAGKKDARWIKNRYVQAFDTLICVDDANSSNYNKLVDKDTARHDYNSFEYMHLRKDYYKWGLFINHNSGQVTPGDGSCVFIHIWDDDHTGTTGCTAMAESDMLHVLHWINSSDRPLLVQMPLGTYQKLRQQYGLPRI